MMATAASVVLITFRLKQIAEATEKASVLYVATRVTTTHSKTSCVNLADFPPPIISYAAVPFFVQKKRLHVTFVNARRPFFDFFILQILRCGIRE